MFHRHAVLREGASLVGGYDLARVRVRVRVRVKVKVKVRVIVRVRVRVTCASAMASTALRMTICCWWSLRRDSTSTAGSRER